MSPAHTLSQRYRQAGRDVVFLLLLWPLLLLGFCLVVPLLSAGAGTAIIWVGLPLLVVALHLSSGLAEIGRRAVSAVDSSEYQPGSYRAPRPDRGAMGRLLAPLADQQRWLDALWVVLGFVVGAVTWALAVAWAAVCLAAPLGPAVEIILNRALGDEQTDNVAELLGLEPDPLWMSLLYLVVALVFIGLAPAVLRALAATNQAVARILLCERPAPPAGGMVRGLAPRSAIMVP